MGRHVPGERGPGFPFLFVIFLILVLFGYLVFVYLTLISFSRVHSAFLFTVYSRTCLHNRQWSDLLIMPNHCRWGFRFRASGNLWCLAPFSTVCLVCGVKLLVFTVLDVALHSIFPVINLQAIDT